MQTAQPKILTRRCDLPTAARKAAFLKAFSPKWLALLLCVACLLGGAATGRSQTVYKGVVSGEILVKIGKAPHRTGQKVARADSGNRAKAAKVHARLKAKVAGDFDYLGWQSIKLPAGKTVAQALKDYKGQPGILAVESVGVRQLSATPNDPSYSVLYGMQKIGAPTAWDKTTGSSDVVVAVVDTGVRYTHEELAANMWRNPGESGGGKETNGVDDDGNGYKDDVFGIDPYSRDSNPMDSYGHGTHVAGTIGAVGNNGRGITGVNWNVKMMALRAGDRYLSTSALLASLNYILMMKTRKNIDIRVVNHSYGSNLYYQSEKDAFDALGNAGIINVCAAGNDGSDNDATPMYPSGYDSPNLIAVAASTKFDDRASFSNYGVQSVDLAAPGVGIYSTTYSGDVTFGYADGTSMATPHVVGAAALIAAYKPHWSAGQIVNRILSTVDQLPQWDGIVATGGRLNVGTALSGLTGPGTQVSLVAPAQNEKVSALNYTLKATTTRNADVVRMDFAVIKRDSPNEGQVEAIDSDTDGPDANGDFSAPILTVAFAPGYYTVSATAVFNDSSTETTERAVLFAQPLLAINDVSVSEGPAPGAPSGTNSAVFTISLSTAATIPVTVFYSTADGTATGAADTSGDYVTTTGSHTFAPGELATTITVPVVGNTTVGPNKTFFVNILSVNAALSDTQGVGTILDDDIDPQTLVVTTPADSIDDSDGLTSLREAMIRAGSKIGQHTITFDATVFGTAQTITLSGSVLPDIFGGLVIDGPVAGVTIDAANLSKIFKIASNATVTLNRLTIINGYDSDTVRGAGAGILSEGAVTLNNCVLRGHNALNGAAITSKGELVLNNCVIRDNQGRSGNGIYSTGSLIATDCTINANNTTGYGAVTNFGTSVFTRCTISGNTANIGGGIYSQGEISLTDCIISDNVSRYSGGGLSCQGTQVSITRCTISGNSASTGGGGIFNQTLSVLEVVDSTISGNSCGFYGGGIYSRANTTVINTTVSGNTATGTANNNGGGGIAFEIGDLVLDSCTISNNTAPNTTSGVRAGLWVESGTLTMRNSLLWGNGAGDMQRDGGTLTSQGSNLIGKTNVAASFNGTGDQTNVTDAKIGSLASNGGPTKTHALLTGSPALNTGSTTQTTDQRGAPRPTGSAADIGAFEFNNPPVVGTNTGLTLQNGTTATIGNSLLQTTDADGDPFTYTITSLPAKGTLKLGGSTLAVNDTFTQSDIDNERLSVTAGATLGADSFGFSVSDGNANPVTGTFNITITETPSLVVNTTSDSSTSSDELTSLREALNYANAHPNGAAPDEITFATPLFSTAQVITLSSELPFLNDDVKITGPGAKLLTLRGNGTVGGGFTVVGKHLTVKGFTFDTLDYGIGNFGTATISECASLNTYTGGLTNWGTATVTNCTFTDSQANALENRGNLTAINCTLSGSDVGIVNVGGTGPANLINCTVTGNNVGINSGLPFTLKNSIVAGNTTNIDDAFLGITDGGGNLIGGDAKLGALADNGGAVPTMALSSDSPAVNAGDNALLPGGITTDARGAGFPRRIGGTVDIGAYESTFVANNAPTASGQNVVTDEDTPKLITLGASDADNDTLTYTITQQPANGTLTNENGSAIVNNKPSSNKVRYTPSANYPLDTMLDGSDSFKFKANDGTADSNVATVSITVAAVCDAPLAVGDAYSVNQDGTLTVGVPGVLLNDTELDGDALTAIKLSDPQHGTLTFNANGSFVYQPDAGYAGMDSFTYKASDGFLDSGPATVSITVFATLRLTSFTPAGGGPGTVVTVNGSGLSDVSEVRLNGASVGAFTVVSANKLTFVVPANASSGTISVVTAAGMASSAREFVVAPRLTSYSPGSGVVGSNVTVTGANLAHVTSARLNGTPCAILSRSANSLTFKVLDAASTGKISLSSVGGTVTSSTDFVVLPRFGNFTPSAGGGESRVIVNGSGFTAATEVRINGILAPIVSRSASQLVVVVPLHATTGTVTVTTGAHSVTSTRIFTVLPMVVRFTPGSGAVGSFVTITGSLLSGATDVRFNGRSVGAGNFSVVAGSNGTQLRATVPAGATSGRISVVTPTGTAQGAIFTVTP